MYDEAVTGVRKLTITDGFEVSVKVAALKNQLNFSSMFFDLPNVLTTLENENQRITDKVTEMKKSQEGGSI